MATPAFARAAESYWKSVGKKGAPPELPESDVDAFVELLHLTGDGPDTFHLVELPHDPYPGMVVGDERQPWSFAWAVALAELEPFASRAEHGVTFLADTVADKKGNHRVYSHADGMRGMLEFASLADALAWMQVRVEAAHGKADAAALEAATSKHARALDDAWEESPSSGMYILETLLDAPLVEAWDAYSRGEWPVYSCDAPAFRLRKEDGWERQLSLHLVRRFLEKTIVDFPRSLKAAELGAAHRALLEHLTAFDEGRKLGVVPEPIDVAAQSDDSVIAERAQAWIERHESWQDAGDVFEDDIDDAPKPAPAPVAKPAEKRPAMADLGVTKRKPKGDAAPAQAAPVEDTAPAKNGKPAKATKATKGKAKSKVPDAEALADKTPSGAKDDKLQKLARLALSLDADEEVPEVEDTPFVRKLRAALEATIQKMVTKELIELDEAKRPMLVQELVVAGADARSVKHMLDKLTGTLVASDHVDELYASDDEIQTFFKSQLGA
jgi:hypothetical protein